MENTVKIKKRYLFFRKEAKKILRDIFKIKNEQKNLKNIYLDFLQVAFISRSFSDELLNTINYLESQGVLVDIINLKPNLKKLINRVEKIKEKIQKETGLGVVDK
ncbi:MAG: hypothetical protein A3A94_01040 [Candidatus Portnoybacteria bacterium RIFCSPLOWO2_01_FULL_43_11]|uniref:DUF4325 domain-containing protein n=3 Tax=Bacteria candidate phyla TaxID=1783234 RepID=A0A1G2FIV6_9BACT|nr:MAG: hypothetical protein A2713_00585 [candidate division WWE3 bacterium RIFCSPHIGHO2_01_FULL_35_17]OGZ37767.1 MAG: hypothetical protein A3E90_01000 [Candidatus Portnoybacteria bacterium RIFCSPHIGHO2_12_FULL_40_11]OGZ37823.1 MAG: hypothetical protein A3A94_01040 [Candidatus Portnoybacteria bacterium RIFCSPLOWO2_01_FULL_43_11]